MDLLKKKYSQTKKKFYSKFKKNIKKDLSPQRNFFEKKEENAWSIMLHTYTYNFYYKFSL